MTKFAEISENLMIFKRSLNNKFFILSKNFLTILKKSLKFQTKKKYLEEMSIEVIVEFSCNIWGRFLVLDKNLVSP